MTVETTVRPVVTRLLDPVDRASEILFGLIMVLTFTASLSVTEAARADVRTMLIGALGCNLAWAIIDAAMYLMGTHATRNLAASAVRAVRAAGEPALGRALVAKALPDVLVPALSEADLERMRQHVVTMPVRQPRLDRRDCLEALGVFVLVFACTFPVALPFLLWPDPAAALLVSNTIAVAMLFLTGFALGRHYGRPWHVGLGMVAIGVALLAVAVALGG
jgi:VIT1/CCC1 family predicted Fe2+/Mn2+ transporter